MYGRAEILRNNVMFAPGQSHAVLSVVGLVVRVAVLVHLAAVRFFQLRP